MLGIKNDMIVLDNLPLISRILSGNISQNIFLSLLSSRNIRGSINSGM